MCTMEKGDSLGGDITADKDVSPDDIHKKLYTYFIKKTLEVEHLYPKEVEEIVHIVDLDGAFVDEDGTTVLKAATAYDHGTPAASIVKPADPTKAATAQYTYEFAGWSPVIANVTADATYKATYSSTVNEYRVNVVSNNTNS